MNTPSARPPHLDRPGRLPLRNKVIRYSLIAAVSLAAASIFTARLNPAAMDYISYWSAGKLLLHHGNPYSASSVFSLETARGFSRSRPLVMRNPPWALFLVAPLGFLSSRIGLLVWTLSIGACILLSVRLISPGSRDNPFALLFAPAIACFGSGQTSALLLLGFVLFLRFYSSRPFLAGAALLLMAIKPHLFLLFWLLLLIDCLYRRSLVILAGAASALAAATAFAMLIQPHIWSEYLGMLRTASIDQEIFPTASMQFRLMIDPRAHWLLLVPSTLAIIWSLWFYTRKRKVWDWRVHGILLMLVAILTSPYGWITDEIVLLPSIIFALNLPEKPRYSGWLLVAINGAAVLAFMANSTLLKSPVFLWTPLAWLAWFLYATRGFNQRQQTFTAARSSEAGQSTPEWISANHNA